VPDLRPFHAFRYAPSVARDLSRLLCPPYDVISPAERDRLAALHPANAVHVELPSSYASAAETLTGWIADGTLVRDSQPLIYPYEQTYEAPNGERLVARGVFCLLRLEPYGPTSGVRPHEATLSGPKEDRFRLLSAVRTNLSPVLLMYDASVSPAMDELAADPPAATGTTADGNRHRLWAVDPARSGAAREFLRVAAVGPLTIADGHHRYETALRYAGQPDAPRGADHALVLLYEAHSGGLALRPWHRLLSGVDADGLSAAAREFYRVEPRGSVADLVAAVGDGTDQTGRIGLWTRAGGWLLTVDRARVAPLLDASASEMLRWLDVNVLSVTLSRMIGASADSLAADGRLTYASDAAEAVASVESGTSDACFVLQPTPIESVLGVAAAGEYMPPKSTYFQPKAATGLVFNQLF
jgi:uncharacterized protein (DUF1015 family)